MVEMLSFVFGLLDDIPWTRLVGEHGGGFVTTKQLRSPVPTYVPIVKPFVKPP